MDAADESLVEQQFRKLDAISFVCEKSGAILLVPVAVKLAEAMFCLM